ncbi:hypothetical protein [Clostridium ihumii]|uniref:hypothetical protein n=1 Tax=Clostridium ihumii TaxID=1470356 RepID=UPI00058E4CD2|nr:hypothetical protein [Clostridium ihumii]
MSLMGLMGSIFFTFMAVLLFGRKRVGNSYIRYGILTFIFILSYGLTPSVPEKMQSLTIFVGFSTMLILIGLTFGLFVKLINKSDKSATVLSITASLVLMILMFNARGYLNYMYIPVLMYLIQGKFNEKIKKDLENENFNLSFKERMRRQ